MDIDPTQAAPATPPVHNLTANYDYEMGGGVGGDNTAPRGGGRGGMVWTADGRSLIDVVGKQGSALLVSIDASTGAVKELTAEKQAVVGFCGEAGCDEDAGADLDASEYWGSVFGGDGWFEAADAVDGCEQGAVFAAEPDDAGGYAGDADGECEGHSGEQD